MNAIQKELEAAKALKTIAAFRGVPKETANEIIFTNRMPKFLRVIIGLAGLLPLMAPYEILIKPGWEMWEELSWIMVFPLFIAGGATLIAVAFIGGALFGPDHVLHISFRTRTITDTSSAPLIAERKRRYRPREVAKIYVKTHESEDSPDTYSLEFHFNDKRKIDVGRWSERDEAEAYLEKVRTSLWDDPAYYPSEEGQHMRKRRKRRKRSPEVT